MAFINYIATSKNKLINIYYFLHFLALYTT